MVVGQDLVQEPAAVRGEADAPGAAVVSAVVAGDEAAVFEAVDEAGDIGAVHDEGVAEGGLGEAVGMTAEEVEDVELAGAEVPAGEEGVAGVPDDVGGAQEGEQGGIPRAGTGRLHGECMPLNC